MYTIPAGLRQLSRSLIAMLIIVFSLSAVAAADASEPVRAAKKAKTPIVGIGENNAPMFSDPRYLALKTKVSRRMVPFDFYQDPYQLGLFTAWINAATAAGIEPLIAFERSYTNLTKLPTVAEYAASLQYLRSNWPAITKISPWNEANHRSQPTAKNPRRAAEYFNQTKIICPSCTIIAADLLDQDTLLAWVKKFKKYAKNPKIWGLHAYTDTNRNKPWKKSITKKFLAATKGDVWLTESGGIVAFGNAYAFSPGRAAKSITRTLDLGLKSPRIKRVYLYSWFGAMNDGSSGYPYIWDSGLVSPDGTLRPGYNSVKNWLAKHR